LFRKLENPSLGSTKAAEIRTTSALLCLYKTNRRMQKMLRYYQIWSRADTRKETRVVSGTSALDLASFGHCEEKVIKLIATRVRCLDYGSQTATTHIASKRTSESFSMKTADCRVLNKRSNEPRSNPAVSWIA